MTASNSAVPPTRMYKTGSSVADCPSTVVERQARRQLSDQLQRRIGGETPSGDGFVGSDVILAEQFGLTDPIVGGGISGRVDQPVLVRAVDQQAVPLRISRPLKLTSLFDDLEQDGKYPETTVLLDQVGPTAPVVSALLGVDPTEPVLHLRRVRIAEGEPLAILENFLPVSRVEISRGELRESGLYRAIRAAGVQLRVAQQRIAARTGTAEECELLDEAPLSPLLTMERVTHDDTGRVVEWGRHVYRASRYEFTVTLHGR